MGVPDVDAKAPGKTAPGPGAEAPICEAHGGSESLLPRSGYWYESVALLRALGLKGETCASSTAQVMSVSSAVREPTHAGKGHSFRALPSSCASDVVEGLRWPDQISGTARSFEDDGVYERSISIGPLRDWP